MLYKKWDLILCFCFFCLSEDIALANPSKSISWIEENKGQHDSKALFIGKAPGLNIYFFKDSVIYQYYTFIDEVQTACAKSTDFPDSVNKPGRVILNHKTIRINTPDKKTEPVPSGPKGTYVNYFYGNDPGKWIRRLQQYSSLTYVNSDDCELLNFFCWGDSITISESSDYSDIFSPGLTSLKASPVKLIYSGFLSDHTYIYSFDIDKSHNIFATGQTHDRNFPITPNALDTIHSGTSAFLSKFNKTGDSLLYSSFLGHFTTIGSCIKLDPTNQFIYIAGNTSDANFPVTPGVVQNSFKGLSDAFLTKLTIDGDSIENSTYIGGQGVDWIYDFILTLSGDLIITGWAFQGFPTTPGCYQSLISNQPGVNSDEDIFVSKVNPQFDSLLFSTYIGGINAERGVKILFALDSNFCILASSQGMSPITFNSYDTSYNGGLNDIYICLLSSGGDSLLSATYVGGQGWDRPGSLIIDGSGIYVGGETNSDNFPFTQGAYDTTYSFSYDVFLSKLSLNLNSILASTYLGDSSWDHLHELNIYRNNLLFSGSSGIGFPLTGNALNTTFNDGMDMYFGIINKDITDLKYSTCFGGTIIDGCEGHIILNDTLFLYGESQSPDFPVTTGCFSGFANFMDWAGCYSIFTLNFTPEAEFTIPDTICLGKTISIENVSFWADSALWTFGNGDSSLVFEPQYTYTSPGTYIITLIVTNAYGSDTLTRQITVLNSYLNNLQKEICQGDSAFLQGSWQHLSGVYTDSLQTLSGCDSIIVTSLTVSQVYQFNHDDTICEGDSAWLAGSWQFIEGIYTDNLQSVFGCDSVVITQLAVQPLPLFSLPIDTMICEDQQLLLDAGIANMYYQWSTSDTTQSITITPQSGVYSITVTNKWECSDTASINVETVPLPVSFLSDSIIICQGEEITLDAGNCPNCTYNWSEGSSVPSITISQKGTYIVIIKNTLCTLNDTIEVSSCSHLEMPNVFTPNDDGKNDRFLPKTYENIEQYKIEIFNRWGSLMYKSSDISEGWDGRYKGQECSSGTYFYNARYKGPGSAYSEKEETLQGVVTLLR